MHASADADEQQTHIVGELGMAIEVVDGGLHGGAAVVPQMHVPGTRCLRTSILATWADLLCGLLAVDVIAPRVPVTVELAVDLYRAPVGCVRVEGVARTLKAGRSVVVTEVDFTTQDGERLAIGTASFMPAPDAGLRLPESSRTLSRNHDGGRRLTRPFAERAGCERRERGVAALSRSEDGLNSAKSINGGLIALAVEEAALSATDAVGLSSLAMRYLRAARNGPVVATAATHGDLARVEVRDAGNDDRLAVVATTRTVAGGG